MDLRCITKIIKNITGMNKVKIKDSSKKLKAIDAVYKVEESTEISKPLTIVKCKHKRSFWQRFRFFYTILGAYWKDTPEHITYSWELYILPMLRYSYRGDGQYIHFRWLIWAIEFKVK